MKVSRSLIGFWILSQRRIWQYILVTLIPECSARKGLDPPSSAWWGRLFTPRASSMGSCMSRVRARA